MNRWYLLVATSLVVCITALWVAMAPVAAQKNKAPCPPFCDPPIVSWWIKCVNPSATNIRAPLNAQWVTFGSKLCFVVPDERPIE